MSPYKNLFEPIVVGGCTIPNRIVRTAHSTGLSGDGLIAYHEERAKGGVGMTTLEAASVHASAPDGMSAWSDDCIPFYQQLTRHIAPHGMKLFQQLYYPGASAGRWSVGTVPNPMTGRVPFEMTQTMIDEMVESFVRAARRCEAGGLDGVDIHASSGYLLHEFLSPALNRRTDRYGGSFENRLRLLREVISGIRSEVSKDFVVGVRLPNNDYVPGGLTPELNARIAAAIDASVDYISLHMGSYWRFHKLIAPTDDPLGTEMPANRLITPMITKPSIVVGRIMTLDHASALVRNSEADMVSMVRALIADPYLVNKARNRQEHTIRPCIGSNQGCVGRLMTSGRMSCVVNAVAARETEFSFEPENPAREGKNVVVVGGGPAGMEAARTAAMRGHRVTLHEATTRLGGQVAIAASAPHRADIGVITSWLAEQLAELEVDVRLNSLLDVDQLVSAEVDAVIVATGATPREDGFQVSTPDAPIPGHDLPHVHNAWSLLGVGSPPDLRGPVVIFDDTGTFEAISAADVLLNCGLAVTMVSRLEVLGGSMPFPAVTVQAARERLMGQDFEFVGGHYLRAITGETVEIGVPFTDRVRRLPAGTVILAGFNEPNRELGTAFEQQGFNTYWIGDVNGSRDILSAIHSAAEVARAI
ncbi:MAG: FAD-dependent oxidoreductase [Haliea sp.]